MKVMLTLTQQNIIEDALNEALEGAIHFKDMGNECPHCKFQKALEVLDKAETVWDVRNAPKQCDQCGMIQVTYVTCACGNTIGV